MQPSLTYREKQLVTLACAWPAESNAMYARKLGISRERVRQLRFRLELAGRWPAPLRPVAPERTAGVGGVPFPAPPDTELRRMAREHGWKWVRIGENAARAYWGIVNRSAHFVGFGQTRWDALKHALESRAKSAGYP